MMTTVSTSTGRRSFLAAVAEYLEHGHDLTHLARAAGVRIPKLRAAVEDTAQVPDSRLIEKVSQVLHVDPGDFTEYRLAVVLDALAKRPVPLHQLFLDSLSLQERELVGEAEFSDKLLAPAVWSLLAKHEITQQELAESIGLSQSYLSRVMNGYEPSSVDLLETVAQALDVAPEFFVEYRVALLADWLLQTPERIDELYAEAAVKPRLEEYVAWEGRELPPPDAVDARSLIESLLEIVRAEGPVLGARVYELRLEASGLSETRDLRSLLNRASAAAARANLIVATNETDEETQRFRTLRLPTTPEVVMRTLGPRRVCHVPTRELTALIRSTTAWKQRRSITEIQRAIVDIYALRHVSPADVEHVNRCINNSWRETGND